jgi:hypothetical protein
MQHDEACCPGLMQLVELGLMPRSAPEALLEPAAAAHDGSTALSKMVEALEIAAQSL